MMPPRAAIGLIMRGSRLYHESFYRFVEPTGATPFSKPARERALHAVLTAMLRQRTGLCEDRDAINFDKEYFTNTIIEIESFIVNRIKSINSRADNGMKDDIVEVHTEMELFFDEWQKAVDDCKNTDSTVAVLFWQTIHGHTAGWGVEAITKTV